MDSLGAMIDSEVEKLRHAPQRQYAQPAQVNEGVAIAQMTDSALVAAQRDAKALEQAKKRFSK